ncbi:MAG: uracil-DNA glycosylase family protein [Syntrophomonas sp.]
MINVNREQNIKKIIEMEDRICECQRCTSLVRCVRKPSQGKGDLEPILMLVFEYENDFCKETNNIIELRDLIKKETDIQHIYHTFMVRCCPKSCANLPSSSCYFNNKLMDKDYNCRLSRSKCDGIPVRPGNEEIMSCLPFLMEEIETLEPHFVLLFGDRVSTFVLRSYGVFDDPIPGHRYQTQDKTLICAVKEELFNSQECRRLFE